VFQGSCPVISVDTKKKEILWIAGAAFDTFTEQPYHGELVRLETCLCTPHMGSMSADCRLRMEYGAARNAIASLRDEPLDELEPESESAMRASEKEPLES